MNKLWKTISCMMMAAALILAIPGCGTDDTYTAAAFVTEVSAMENLVSFTDETGNVWMIHDDSDWSIGEYVVLLMDDCGTGTIYDNQIVDIWY